MYSPETVLKRLKQLVQVFPWENSVCGKDDLVQDAFLLWWEHKAKAPEPSFTYLKRGLFIASKVPVREKKRQNACGFMETFEAPEDRIELLLTDLLIETYLGALTKTQRTIMEGYLDGVPLRKQAKILGKSKTGVVRIRERAAKKLRGVVCIPSC